MSQYSAEQRQFILNEIEKWRKENLITETKADMMRHRYLEEVSTPVSESIIPPAISTECPVQESLQKTFQKTLQKTLQPSHPAPLPRPTLAQALLSETSIKIALYLGAFFVIAAALILAALVATLRLPILLGASTLFGAGSLLLKTRLPQPSLILWLVFNVLLLISAGVQADLLQLYARPEDRYWIVVFSLVASLCWIGTWLFQSRIFSLFTFAALAFSAWYVADFYKHPEELYFFMLALAGVVGLLASWKLKHWQSRKLYLPLFWTVQLYEFLLIVIAVIIVLTNCLFSQYGCSSYMWRMFGALTFITFFIFYFASNQIISLRSFFPPMAAVALFPVAWLALSEFKINMTFFSIGWGVWGVLLLLVGEAASFFQSGRFKHFSLPVTVSGTAVIFVSGLLGYFEHAWLGLSLFTIFSALFTLLQIRQARWWIWVAGCIALLMAYFSIFKFDPIQDLKIVINLIFAGAILPMALIDLLLPGDYKSLKGWRWPLRSFAIIMFCLANLPGASNNLYNHLLISISYFIVAVLGMIYALRFRVPFMQLFFTLYFPFASILFLDYISSSMWRPVLTGEAIGYYLLGYLLAYKIHKSIWADIWHWSGLILGVAIAMLTYSEISSGSDAPWFIGIIGLMFVYEALTNFAWLEIAVHGLYVLAFFEFLLDRRSSEISLYIIGAGILILGLDMLFMRIIKNRKWWKWLLRTIGWLVVLVGNFFLLLHWQNVTAMTVGISIACSVMCLIYALFYRQNKLGYFCLAVLPVTILICGSAIGLQYWTGVLILLSLLYYALSLFAKLAEFGVILRYSGVALATLVAVSAPFEHSGMWVSIPIALAATLWAIETLRRRNVWLGFVANGLYLLAYCTILLVLKVDEPQFYSVGAALLGTVMHYLLLRSEANVGAFLTGMTSQLVLLGTTYVQMVSTNSLWFFIALFFQSLVVMLYGLIIRSRSLVFTPIIIVVIGVFTVVFSLSHLRGIGTVILVGFTGVLFIVLGILAVLMRERLASLRERLSAWNA